MKIMKIFALVALIIVLIFTGMTQSHADDVDLFLAQIPPDALIVLDLSLSMNLLVTGETTMYISASSPVQYCATDVAYYLTSGTGHTKGCPLTTYFPRYGDASCSGPIFYLNNSHTGYTTDCSRLGIAKNTHV